MRFALLLVPALLLAACAGSTTPDPASRARDSGRLAAGDDPADLEVLVERLASDDSVVREVSISALEERTGRRLGYRADALPADRQVAIERWQALIRGEGPFSDGSERTK